MSTLRTAVCKKLGLSATASQADVYRAALGKLALSAREWRGWIVKKGTSSRIASVQVYASSAEEAKQKAVEKMLDMDYPAAKYEIGGITDTDTIGSRPPTGDAGPYRR